MAWRPKEVVVLLMHHLREASRPECPHLNAKLGLWGGLPTLAVLEEPIDQLGQHNAAAQDDTTNSMHQIYIPVALLKDRSQGLRGVGQILRFVIESPDSNNEE